MVTCADLVLAPGIVLEEDLVLALVEVEDLELPVEVEVLVILVPPPILSLGISVLALMFCIPSLSWREALRFSFLNSSLFRGVFAFFFFF